jgi:hypothetical protein
MSVNDYSSAPFYGYEIYERCDLASELIYYDERYILDIKSKNDIKREILNYYSNMNIKKKRYQNL